MKYIIYPLLVIAGFIVLYKVYLSETHVGYFYRQLISEPCDYRKPILYKELESIEDINGTYKLFCKYIPEDYEVGVGFKYTYLPTGFHKKNPKSKGKYTIKTKLRIKDKKGKIVYEKASDKVRGYSNVSLEYYSMLPLENFWLEEREGYTLEIDFIESDIKNVPKDLMYLYIRVNTTW